MGEWKAQLSLRVRLVLRQELEAIAAREHRKLGNLSYEQLKEAGNTDRLLQCRLRLPEEPPQQSGTQRRANGK
jgi:hypothetical protein